MPLLRFIVWSPPALFTRTVIFGYSLRASVAPHRAAPVELAVAAADDLDALLHHPEAAFVAQPAAALPLPLRHVLVALQTLPPLGALESRALVPHAIVRRILQVNELRPGNAAKSVRDGSSSVRAVPGPRRLLVHLQFLCLLVLRLQIVPNLPEVGQLHPAGLDAAAPGHPVTLAGSPHGSFDCLPR